MSTTPGLVETLAADWQKAARFYARYGITEQQLRQGVPQAETSAEAEVVGSLGGVANFKEAATIDDSKSTD